MNLVKKWQLFLALLLTCPILSAAPLFTGRWIEFNNPSSSMNFWNNGNLTQGGEAFEELTTADGDITGPSETGAYSWTIDGSSTDQDKFDATKYVDYGEDYALELNTQGKTLAVDIWDSRTVNVEGTDVIRPYKKGLSLLKEKEQSITMKTQFVFTDAAPSEDEIKNLKAKVAIWANGEGKIEFAKLGFNEEEMKVTDEVFVHTTNFTVDPDKYYTVTIEAIAVEDQNFVPFAMYRLLIQSEDASQPTILSQNAGFDKDQIGDGFATVGDWVMGIDQWDSNSQTTQTLIQLAFQGTGIIDDICLNTVPTPPVKPGTYTLTVTGDEYGTASIAEGGESEGDFTLTIIPDTEFVGTVTYTIEGSTAVTWTNGTVNLNALVDGVDKTVNVTFTPPVGDDHIGDILAEGNVSEATVAILNIIKNDEDLSTKFDTWFKASNSIDATSFVDEHLNYFYAGLPVTGDALAPTVVNANPESENATLAMELNFDARKANVPILLQVGSDLTTLTETELAEIINNKANYPQLKVREGTSATKIELILGVDVQAYFFKIVGFKAPELPPPPAE